MDPTEANAMTLSEIERELSRLGYREQALLGSECIVTLWQHSDDKANKEGGLPRHGRAIVLDYPLLPAAAVFVEPSRSNSTDALRHMIGTSVAEEGSTQTWAAYQKDKE